MKKLILAQLNNLRVRVKMLGRKKTKLEFICKYSKICLTTDEIKKKQCTEEYAKECSYSKSYALYGDDYNHLGI